MVDEGVAKTGIQDPYRSWSRNGWQIVGYFRLPRAAIPTTTDGMIIDHSTSREGAFMGRSGHQRKALIKQHKPSWQRPDCYHALLAVCKTKIGELWKSSCVVEGVWHTC